MECRLHQRGVPTSMRGRELDAIMDAHTELDIMDTLDYCKSSIIQFLYSHETKKDYIKASNSLFFTFQLLNTNHRLINSRTHPSSSHPQPHSMTNTFLNRGLPATKLSTAFCTSDKGYFSIIHLTLWFMANRIASSLSRACPLGHP